MSQDDTWKKKCLTTEDWYYCPVSIITFSVFVFLFVYGIFVCANNWKAINAETDQVVIDTSKLKQVQSLYIVNLICTFISFGVIVFFITRAIGTSQFLAVFNKYIAIAIILFLIVVSSWNIHVYSQIDGDHNAVQTVNGVVLGISCVIVAVIIGMFVYAQMKAKAKKSA